MKIYVVTEVIDDEYGYTETIAVFSSQNKAEEFVNKNQYQWSAWFMEEGETRDALKIHVFELDKAPVIKWE